MLIVIYNINIFELKKMEINDLRVQMYNKVADLKALCSPQLLCNLCILEKKDYVKSISCFDVIDNNSHREQLYVSKVPPKDVLRQIIFLKESPKILYLGGESETLVIQEKIEDRLSDYVIFHDSKSTPYLLEQQARNIMMDLIGSLQDFLKHKLIYDCFSLKNIVQINEKWQLSTVGYIFNVDQNNSDYTHPSIKDPQNLLAFSLGALLFKLIFGFPFYSPEKPIPKDISFKNQEPYLEYLETLSDHKHLKIYYFIQRFISVSSTCLNLLQKSLSGKMTLNQWKQHEFFTTPLKYKSKLDDRNRQILMMNSVSQKKLSIMLAAIEYKKKYPFEKLNRRPLPDPEDQSYAEIVESYGKNYLLRNLNFAPNFQKKLKIPNNEQNHQIDLDLIGDYFYQQSFDPLEDYPCRDLNKFIENDRQQNPNLYQDGQKAQSRQAELKLYAFPYAMAFELIKVEAQQPINIKRRIKQMIELLLNLSSFYKPKNVKPLYQTNSNRFKDFSEMKGVYRENINELYRYFLTEAMRKYNVKKQNIQILERKNKKKKGLDYYKLCLKLLEASLLVRKGGKDLNLVRIETSQRKQIQNDLEELLKNYFPTKAQIF